MKTLMHLPVREMIIVHAAWGKITMVTDRYGECRSCTEKVWFCRHQPKDQWVPVKQVGEDHELHRCDGEVKRNATLRRLLSGQ